MNFLLFAKHEPKNCLSDFSWCIISTFWFMWIVRFATCAILRKLWKYMKLNKSIIALEPTQLHKLILWFFQVQNICPLHQHMNLQNSSKHQSRFSNSKSIRDSQKTILWDLFCFLSQHVNKSCYAFSIVWFVRIMIIAAS